MARERRFKVDSLSQAVAGSRIELPADQAKHAKVLRLKGGARVELFDASGGVARGELDADGRSVVVSDVANASGVSAQASPKAILATAWPKGKRAAWLVEKCAELGVSEIVPIRFVRSVVTKDEEGEGFARLRRIAEEAAKQSGRTDVPLVSGERSFGQLVSDEVPNARAILLDPRARESLPEALAHMGAGLDAADPMPWLFIVGPEGGFSPDEAELAERAGLQRARLGRHILRIETAGLAALAVWAASIGMREQP